MTHIKKRNHHRDTNSLTENNKGQSLSFETNPKSRVEINNQGKLASGKYLFATVKENYEDLSSGRVLYGAPGATGFPVRLASEIFQRCAARLVQKGTHPPYVFYDPCCGGGYSATVIGYLHGNQISTIYASDIRREAIELARKNLSLLNPTGLNQRLSELNLLTEKFNKKSHMAALESGARLESKLVSLNHQIQVKCFQFDILGNTQLYKEIEKVDLVLSDVPYGQATSWSGAIEDSNPIQRLLTNISQILSLSSVVAITMDKKQALSYKGYRRLEDTKIGKRRFLLLEPVENSNKE